MQPHPKTLIVALAFFVLLCCPRASRAQTETTGAIQGRVYEVGTNQPLAGVVVTITSREQGFARPTRTDARGQYFMGLLPPGGYSLSASLLGYEIDPNATASEIPIRLSKTEIVIPPPIGLRKIGTFGTPTVGTKPTPDVPLVQLVNTLNAARGESFGRERLWALPLAGGRAFDQLALLAPGVAPAPQAIGQTVGPGLGPGVGTAGQFAVNGLRSRGNNFTVDGSDNNDEDIGVRRQGFTALQPQAVESLHEYQILTFLPEPQFGRNLGAQVNAVSRSGANQMHGTVYGFFTDRSLKAREPFDATGGPATFPLKRAGDGAAIRLNGTAIELANPVGEENPFTRAQYGFALSGPLVKSRTMLFGSFERQDVNAARESHFAVPTVAERGLFGSGERGLRFTSQNAGQTVVRDAYPTSAVGDAFFSLFPLPNNPDGPYRANTFTEVLRAGADASLFAVKLDQGFQAFRRAHTASARYNFSDDATMLPVTGEAIFSSLRAAVRTQNLALSLYSSLSARLANQMRFSYGRTRLDFTEARNRLLSNSRRLPGAPYLLNATKLLNSTCPTDSCLGSGARGATGFRTQGTTEEGAGGTGPLGQLIVSGYSPVGVDVYNFPQRRVSNMLQFADTLVLSLSRHRLTAGADVRHLRLDSRVDRNFRPLAVFSGAPDIAPRLGFPAYRPTGNATGFNRGADFVAVGAATGFFQTLALDPDATIRLRFWQSSFFVSDQVRLRPNFTLTLGARYERSTVPREADDRIERTFGAAEVARLADEERRLFGVSGFAQFLAGREGIYRADNNNIAPYTALAWDPFGKGRTAVRAGFGMYYDQIPGVVISHSRSVFPSFLTLNLAGLATPETPIQKYDFFSLNPARLAATGTLNTYDAGRLGRDPVAALLLLNRFTAPIAPRPGQTTETGQTFPGGPGFVLPAADLRTPYSQHWGITIEQEVKRDWLAALAYVGTRGVHLLRFATPNLGPNTLPVITGERLTGFDPIFTGFAVAPGRDFKRPFPLLGSFTSIESDANSSYHSLQLQIEKRATRGLQFAAFYVWSHALDEVSDLFDLAGARALPQDSFDRRAERGNAGFDVRHRFVTNWVWNLPPLVRSKGWQLAGIVTLQTGQPYTLLAGYDVNLDGNLTDRLNSTAAILDDKDGAQQFRLAAGAALTALLAPVGRNGATGRNTMRAPGRASVDLALNKHFKFRERLSLEWRSEVFNLLNRTHFGIPVHQLDFPGFGQSVTTQLPLRTVQFALRLGF